MHLTNPNVVRQIFGEWISNHVALRDMIYIDDPMHNTVLQYSGTTNQPHRFLDGSVRLSHLDCSVRVQIERDTSTTENVKFLKETSNRNKQINIGAQTQRGGC